MFRFIALLVCAVLIPAAGAATKKAPTSPAHARSKTPVRKKISDPDLEKAIRARFAASKISTNHFEAHVQGGVATLDGQTDVIQHKGTATRLAKAAGAVKVVNRIRISQAARDKAAANLAKGRRRAQIKRGEPRSSRANVK